MEDKDLKQRLKQCYGESDHLFAQHWSDHETAAKLLKDMIDEKVTWPQLETVAQSLFDEWGLLPEKKIDSMKSLRDISSWLEQV
jgi:hypothetical protein